MDRAVAAQARQPRPIGRPYPVKGADELYGELLLSDGRAKEAVRLVRARSHAHAQPQPRRAGPRSCGSEERRRRQEPRRPTSSSCELGAGRCRACRSSPKRAPRSAPRGRRSSANKVAKAADFCCRRCIFRRESARTPAPNVDSTGERVACVCTCLAHIHEVSIREQSSSTVEESHSLDAPARGGARAVPGAARVRGGADRAHSMRVRQLLHV